MGGDRRWADADADRDERGGRVTVSLTMAMSVCRGIYAGADLLSPLCSPDFSFDLLVLPTTGKYYRNLHSPLINNNKTVKQLLPFQPILQT